MSIASGTLDLHPELHNEFHFADNAVSEGCCCCWKSKPKAPSEFIVTKDNKLQAAHKCDYRTRIIANQRLSEILKMKFDSDAIENDKAFEMLKMKINDLGNGDPITSEKLIRIIQAIHELKEEIRLTRI